jgi:hypothetical protein
MFFMKKIFVFVLGIAVLFQITSCSTKVNLDAPYKHITVINGLLDMADTAHYIRIEKTFLSPTLSAFSIAQISDSSFFPQLNVVIKAVNSQGVIDQTIPLTRVDLNTEGYPKNAGTFFTGPNYAYKFKGTLLPGDTYRLVVSNPTTGEVDSAVTYIIDDIKADQVFTIPGYDDITDPSAGIHFANNTTNSYLNISGDYSSSGSNVPVPAVFQCTLRLRWVDQAVSGSKTEQSADYNFGTVGLGGTGGFSFIVYDNVLYQFVLNSMAAAPVGVSRYLDSCDIFVYAGTADLNTYQQISQAQGTGLTADEIEPNYTNIKGANVLGLFTGRGVRTDRVRIDAVTVDSLVRSANNGYLSGTNIKGTAY